MNRLLTALVLCAAMLATSANAFAAKLIKPATANKLIRSDAKSQFPAVKRWSVKLDEGSLGGSKWFTATQIIAKNSPLTVEPAEVRGIINLNKRFKGPRINYPKRSFK